MKRARYNKVLGLALGERSLLAAEITAGPRPQIKRLAEFVYPEGAWPAQGDALGAALRQFLKENRFTAKAAVIGIPLKWLVAKAKEVPPADAVTLASMLRLQAESEFSSDLKDLVYDYLGESSSEKPGSVLLVATPGKYIEAAKALLDGAKLDAVGLMPSAVALGAASGQGSHGNAVVLAVGSAGAELTAQSPAAPMAVRHLRAPTPPALFLSELRRAVSMLPPGTGKRQMIVWDAAGLDADALASSIGLPIRDGEMGLLGVDAPPGYENGQGSPFAAAVALALAGLAGGPLPVDFLHSRLAPPRQRRVPRWAVTAALAVIAFIGACVYAYTDLRQQEQDLAALQARFETMKPQIAAAESFVSTVSFAQGWHGGQARYVACLRDLTLAMPEDGQTYVTSLLIRETARQPGQGAPPPASQKPPEARTLAGQLYGKAADQEGVQALLDQLKHNKQVFSDVKLGGTQDAGRGREVSFSISFTYTPRAPRP